MILLRQSSFKYQNNQQGLLFKNNNRISKYPKCDHRLVLWDRLTSDETCTCRTRDVAGTLKVNLGLKGEGVKAVQKELPAEDSNFGQHKGEQLNAVQYQTAISNDRVKLELQAMDQALQHKVNELKKDCYCLLLLGQT